jgi:hypothetical protein
VDPRRALDPAAGEHAAGQRRPGAAVGAWSRRNVKPAFATATIASSPKPPAASAGGSKAAGARGPDQRRRPTSNWPPEHRRQGHPRGDGQSMGVHRRRNPAAAKHRAAPTAVIIACSIWARGSLRDQGRGQAIGLAGRSYRQVVQRDACAAETCAYWAAPVRAGSRAFIGQLLDKTTARLRK